MLRVDDGTGACRLPSQLLASFLTAYGPRLRGLAAVQLTGMDQLLSGLGPVVAALARTVPNIRHVATPLPPAYGVHTQVSGTEPLGAHAHTSNAASTAGMDAEPAGPFPASDSSVLFPSEAAFLQPLEALSQLQQLALGVPPPLSSAVPTSSKSMLAGGSSGSSSSSSASVWSLDGNSVPAEPHWPMCSPDSRLGAEGLSTLAWAVPRLRVLHIHGVQLELCNNALRWESCIASCFQESVLSCYMREHMWRCIDDGAAAVVVLAVCAHVRAHVMFVPAFSWVSNTVTSTCTHMT